MDRKSILKKIKEIEIRSNILANEVFQGTYHSYFKGNGIEFSDIRPYSIGDDVKKIDWKVTARQRKTYIKEFVEERELSIFLIVDVSSSNLFEAKRERIAEIIATLSFSACKNNDKVGAIFFSDKVEKIFPLKKGKKHSLAILDSFFSMEHDRKKTNIGDTLTFFNKIMKKRAVVFLISDFYDEGYEKTLKTVSLKHDLIPICLREAGYSHLPKGAIFQLMDSETGEEILLDNTKESFSIEDNFNNKKGINLSMEDDYIKAFIRFFKTRR